MSAWSIVIIFPFVTYLAWVTLFAKRMGVLDAMVKAHLAFFGLVAITTEALSAFAAIGFAPLCAVWGIVSVASIWLFVSARGWKIPSPAKEISLAARLAVGAILLILVLTLGAGLLYPPNNWDSMTYHMARVSHWISQKSVAFYPTNIERQNFSGTLAEFAILHLQLLSGSDLFANMVQWTCFVASIVLGTLIAAELGLGRTGQAITALIIATIPMAVVEGATTQNDLVVSSFILGFAFFLLRLRKAFAWENLLFAGLSLGLALLTKGTGYIYGGAIGLVWAVHVLLKVRSSFATFLRGTGAMLVVVAIALGLNTGHFIRNYKLYGLPVYDAGPMLNQDLSLTALLANIPKNMALHLGTRSPHLNEALEHGLRPVVQVTNQANNYLAIPFHLNAYRRHDDYAGNPLHMLLALIACSLAILWARRQSSQRNWYLLALLISGLCFCLSLKWQPWGSRLQTPWFMLSAPLLVIALMEHAGRAARYSTAIASSLLFLHSVPFALRSEARPLFSREWMEKERRQLYFTLRPKLYQPYERAVEMVENEREVGVYLGGDDWEYPLWVIAMEKPPAIVFRHIGVTEASKKLASDTILPTYLIATAKVTASSRLINYDVVRTFDNVAVLKRKERER